METTLSIPRVQRTKKVILNDDREIAITENQYNAIKADQSIGKFSDPITIRDVDTKEILFDGKIGFIKEFMDIKQTNYTGDKFICDFGIRHPLQDTCNCQEKYKVFLIQFRQKLFELYGHKYAKDLTETERNNIINNIK